MSTGAAAGCRDKEAGAYRYQRHQPENTLLYRIVERYYPEFTAYLAEQGAILPQYVQREFEAYLKCGRLEHGFLRVQCNHCLIFLTFFLRDANLESFVVGTAKESPET